MAKIVEFLILWLIRRIYTYISSYINIDETNSSMNIYKIHVYMSVYVAKLNVRLSGCHAATESRPAFKPGAGRHTEKTRWTLCVNFVTAQLRADRLRSGKMPAMRGAPAAASRRETPQRLADPGRRTEHTSRTYKSHGIRNHRHGFGRYSYCMETVDLFR